MEKISARLHFKEILFSNSSAQSVNLEMFSFISGMMTPLDNKDDAGKELENYRL